MPNQGKSWRERKGRIGPLMKCRKDTCPVILRFDNQTGYCPGHVYLRYLAGDSGLRCKCGAPLRRGNKKGLCLRHRRGKENEPCKRRIDMGHQCVVPRCLMFREVATVPLCPQHLGEWRDSFQRRAAQQAALRFLMLSREPGTPEPAYSQKELGRLADALLGADFERLPSSDAMTKAVYFEDRPRLARQAGIYSKERETA